MNDPDYRRIFKVLIFTRDDPATQGSIIKIDAIEHEGQIWLVPLWLDSKEEAWSMPLRLVCLSAPPIAVHLQKMQGDQADYLLNYPIPILALQKESAAETGNEFVTIEKPRLKIARPH